MYKLIYTNVSLYDDLYIYKIYMCTLHFSIIFYTLLAFQLDIAILILLLLNIYVLRYLRKAKLYRSRLNVGTNVLKLVVTTMATFTPYV